MITNLVLGGEGFVGKTFCKLLEKQGEKAITFDIKNSTKEDCRTAKLNLKGIDRVYFLAWEVGGAKYLYNEDTQFKQLDWNLKLLQNIMPQLQEKKIPFLFVSSQLAEETQTVYGVTKRLGEVWTRLLGGTSVRLWNVYGPIEEPSERTHVVADFVFQALQKGEIRMLTTGEERRQFIHIEDVSRAFHQAISQRLTETYDVTSFEWVKVLDVAKIIAEYTGAKVIPGQKVGSTPITPIRGRIPGWLPEVTLKQGLKQLVDETRAWLKNKK